MRLALSYHDYPIEHPTSVSAVILTRTRRLTWSTSGAFLITFTRAHSSALPPSFPRHLSYPVAVQGCAASIPTFALNRFEFAIERGFTVGVGKVANTVYLLASQVAV